MSRTVPARSGERTLRLYVALLAALAAGSAMASFALDGGPTTRTLWATGGFLVLLAAAEYLLVRFHYREEVMALSLFEAVLAPAIFVLPPVTAIALAGTAQMIAHSMHRVRPIKTTFNVAQWSLATAAGATVFHELRAGTSLSVRNMISLLAALVVVGAVNVVLFSTVIRLAERRPWRAVLADCLPPIAVGWICNVGFGALFVAAISFQTGAIALCIVPLLALHVASRGLVSSVADRQRLGAMNRTLMSLAMPVDPAEAIPHFLTEVRTCFGASAVDVFLWTEGQSATIHRLTDRYEAIYVAGSNLSCQIEGEHRCITAPLIADGKMLGTISVYDSSGFEGERSNELAVLQALAAEAAGIIRRGVLVEAVLEERRKLSEIVTSTSDGIVTIRADGTIESWNPAMEIMTGFKAAEMVGTKAFGALRARDADNNEVFIERWKDGSAPPHEVQIADTTGGSRWLSCSYTPVSGPDGVPHLLVLVARDVTKVRELERLKDDFVATVSHELRTPLTPIIGWASTLLEHDDRIGQKERLVALESIVRQAEGLERLVTDLLEVARVEQGAHDPRIQAVDAIDLARRMADEFRGSHTDRVIKLDIPAEACTARGDDMWIERILSNLLSNAIKYAPAAEPITVRVDRAEGEVTISVTDHGPGIPAHQRNHIFERFSRLGDHMTRTAGGAGLGLYIARQLASSMGATLDVDSEPNVRTTFTLKLRATKKLSAVS